MAIERVTERGDGGTTIIERRGGGAGPILIGFALIALVAIIAFFMISSNRNDTMRTEAVTGAAASVADSAAGAAKSVDDAAESATSK